MKLSYNWLGDFVDLTGLSPQEVADRLTMCAFEVEEVREFGPDLQGEIVVGEIVEINPHPNADKIRLTKVRLAEGSDAREIVCGAWNIEVGHRIPVALPGSTVINRHDGTPLSIKESKIRGATSSGMLCSAPELGLPGSSEGILILPPGTPLGKDARELLHLGRDYILNVAPRSNRGDALSVAGLAREVAACFQRPFRFPELDLPPEAGDDENLAVTVESPDDCPYFTARLINGLQDGPSPPLMARRLEAVGLRTVSVIVDVTNYVMLEMGQPLHAYDLRHLQGRSLAVRRARAGERLTTIDGRERELNEEVLVIADSRRAIGVAGVMGGKDSEISEDTRDIALEAACFNSARVRRASRLLGLSSDSSLRFERGVDIGGVRKASDRATQLLTRYAGGRLGAIAATGSDRLPPQVVTMRFRQLERIAEIRADAPTVESLLAPLGFEIMKRSGEAVQISVPSFRQKDVTREIDLIEEVCRLWGYDRLPSSMPAGTNAPQPVKAIFERVRQSLRGSGLSEAWTSSLISLEELSGRAAARVDVDSSIRVLNPLSDEHQVLRRSLIPGLLRAVAYNQDRGRPDVWLYEIGRVYLKEAGSKCLPSERTTGTTEPHMVASVMAGRPPHHLWREEPEADYFLTRGVVDNLLMALRPSWQRLSFVAGGAPGWFHPGRSASVFYSPGELQPENCSGNGDRSSGANGERLLLGWLGELHPAVAKAYELKRPACIFELFLDRLEKIEKPPVFSRIFPTPAVVRDLSADVSREVETASGLQSIQEAAGELLINACLVSVFKLSNEKKSLTFRLTFQHPERTLKAEEVEERLKNVRERLSNDLGAAFRL